MHGQRLLAEHHLIEGVGKAIQLILSRDPEVVEITARSLAISSTSCVIAIVICLPLGSLIHFQHFPGKKLLISLSGVAACIGVMILVFSTITSQAHASVSGVATREADVAKWRDATAQFET